MINGDGYSDEVPKMSGLYWMRRKGSVDGGRVVEIVPPGKYRNREGGEDLDLPEGYEYKPLDGYGSSA